MDYQKVFGKHRRDNPISLRRKADGLRLKGLRKNADGNEHGKVPRSVAAHVRGLLAAATHIETSERKRGTLKTEKPLKFRDVEYQADCMNIDYYDPLYGTTLAFRVLKIDDDAYRVIAYKTASHSLQMAPINHLIYTSEAEAVAAAEVEVKNFENYKPKDAPISPTHDSTIIYS